MHLASKFLARRTPSPEEEELSDSIGRAMSLQELPPDPSALVRALLSAAEVARLAAVSRMAHGAYRLRGPCAATLCVPGACFWSPIDAEDGGGARLPLWSPAVPRGVSQGPARRAPPDLLCASRFSVAKVLKSVARVLVHVAHHHDEALDYRARTVAWVCGRSDDQYWAMLRGEESYPMPPELRARGILGLEICDVESGQEELSAVVTTGEGKQTLSWKRSRKRGRSSSAHLRQVSRLACAEEEEQSSPAFASLLELVLMTARQPLRGAIMQSGEEPMESWPASLPCDAEEVLTLRKERVTQYLQRSLTEDYFRQANVLPSTLTLEVAPGATLMSLSRSVEGHGGGPHEGVQLAVRACVRRRAPRRKAS